MPLEDLNRATGIALMHNIQLELYAIDREAREWVKENIPLAAKEGIATTLHSLRVCGSNERGVVISSIQSSK
ncbi:hypothetical protein P4261_28010 [Bacillus thuringiensis]|nr:hypothetical protein [Bacillus thuringiensis]MED2829727.1 hypothetical protein [Bacillus thuringiensis]MED2856412.1 hypothetical protein [Bacillus thuringiensis]MED2863783.1 hypothetical protein [Bacillus thuringiensis]